MTTAFVFPGQGAQAIGMGRDLAAAFLLARETFEEVDEALHQNLARIMAEGPESELNLTENAQPALVAVSMATLRVVLKESGRGLADLAAFVAGHSLGEYAALAAAGTFGLADAVRLVKARGQAMQKVVPVGEGAMAALIGCELPLAQEIATAAQATPEGKKEVCSAANDNGGGQVVLSGHKGAVERAIGIAGVKGVKRAIMLQVSAPFHCALMKPAADVMAESLGKVAMHQPAVPLVANVTASHVSDPATIRAQLVEQVTGLVRWRESVAYMVGQGVHRQVELGAGKVLTGLARRIHRDLDGVAVGTAADVESFLKSL
ncbi:MAG: [acyl-carrier-protein] S-malonyltransferase [Alphaproteobacteria bacterium]|nr:[acyl-carrier-protein] S-malonyltransferase [Alphaproteobacteria bacterium]